MQSRNYLKRDDTLILAREKNGENQSICRILNRIGEGGSVVCYQAEYEGRIGTLKEFYPVSVRNGKSMPSFPLNRTGSCQLMAEGALNAMRFSRACEEFTKAYIQLNEAKKEDPQNIVLNNYIPSCDILYGIAGDEAHTAGTVYIWTADAQSGITWKDYISVLAGRREQLSVRDLFDVMTVMMSLADCIKALHSAGLLHLDVKPSNFLVLQNSEGDINPGSISLFDINTLYPMDSRMPKITGTKGYCAPEALRGRPDNRSDIFSIGCVLFESLLLKTKEDPLYDQSDYSELSILVKESAFLENAGTDEEPFIAAALAGILRKCLALRPDSRYDSCEELLEDLRHVREMTVPSGDGRVIRRRAGEDPVSAIQSMLYEYPLYEYADRETETLRILLCGSGNIAQVFLDECLQAGQSADRMLDVTVLTKRPEVDRDVYLEFRPAMGDFINIDGSLPEGTADNYAHLNFYKTDTDSPDAVADAASRLSSAYHYIFISTGDEMRDRTAAEELHRRHIAAAVHYAVRSDTAEEGPLYPVNVASEEPIRKRLPELDRMAFRTHISWNPTMNLDIGKEQKAFRDRSSRKARYNYRSSIASALAVKYKLWSVGISCNDPEQAAREFFDFYHNPEHAETVASMIAAEHRRWVVSLVTEGWTAPGRNGEMPDYEDCVTRGSVKDPARKIHPCLVHSTSEMPLLSVEWKNHAHMWDDPDVPLTGLDELDTMSVRIHRCFLRHVRVLERQQPLYSGDVDALRRMAVMDGPESLEAFHEFEFVLKKILGGSTSFAGEFDHYAERFLRTFADAPEAVQGEYARRVRAVRHTFFPVLEWCAYRDYKDYDRALIEMIPFILTYPFRTGLAMAFDDCSDDPGNMKRSFANVASATAVCPARLLYLVNLDESGEADYLLQRIRAAMEYFEGRGLHIRVNFVIAYSEAVKSRAERLEQMLIKAGERFRGLIWHMEETEAPELFFAGVLSRRSLHYYDATTVLFRESGRQKGFLDRVREVVPVFTFRDKEFKCDGRCEYLQYFKDHSFLRVSDLMSLTKAPKADYSLPDFPDTYPNFQELAGEAGYGTWQALCSILSSYEQTRKPLVRICLKDKKLKNPMKAEYYFPSYAYHAVRYILDQLRYHGVVSPESDLYSYVSGTGRIDLVMLYDIKEGLNMLFSSPQLLASKDSVRIDTDPFFTIRCEDLQVKELRIEDPAVLNLIKKLSEKNYLYQTDIKEREEGGTSVSFIYPAPAFRSLLTDSLELLKICTYYEIRKTGIVRDMALIKRDGVSLLLTRGFTLIVVSIAATGGRCLLRIANIGNGEVEELTGLDEIGSGLSEVIRHMLASS